MVGMLGIILTGGDGVEGFEVLAAQEISENQGGVEGLRGLSRGCAGLDPPPLPLAEKNDVSLGHVQHCGYTMGSHHR